MKASALVLPYRRHIHMPCPIFQLIVSKVFDRIAVSSFTVLLRKPLNCNFLHLLISIPHHYILCWPHYSLRYFQAESAKNLAVIFRCLEAVETNHLNAIYCLPPNLITSQCLQLVALFPRTRRHNMSLHEPLQVLASPLRSFVARICVRS
jgi:hypothetical protein